MKNIAIILAGGSGRRAGGDTPKQFRRLQDGRSVLETCVAAFEDNDQIDDITLVMPAEHLAYARQLSEKNGWHKVSIFVAGGRERWESSWFAIKAVKQALDELGELDCNVLLHDCARPFVSQQIITRVCHTLNTSNAVSVTVPVTDTIYAAEGDRLRAIPPRDSLRRAQTPQAFRLSVIHDAYARALAKAPTLTATDDCGVLLEYRPDTSVTLVQGEESNRKLTYAEDFATL